MSIFRWFFASSARLTMLLAVVLCFAHAASELNFAGKETFLRRIELVSFDVDLRASRPKNPPNGYGVAIVAIDDRSVTRVGRMPWTRSVYARMVDRLTELGAGSIAFDVLFSEPEVNAAQGAYEEINSGALGDLQAIEEALRVARVTQSKDVPRLEAALGALQELREKVRQRAESPGPDEAFARAMKASGRVVLPVEGLSELEVRGLEPNARSAAVRRISTSTLSEILVQRGPLLTRLKTSSEAFKKTSTMLRFPAFRAPTETLAQGTTHFGFLNFAPDGDGVYRRLPLVSGSPDGFGLPSFALAAVAASDVDGRPIQVVGAEPDGDIESIRVRGRSIVTDLVGAVSLWWYGDFGSDIPVISAADLLDGNVEEKLIRGKVIFIGATALGTGDQRVTPVGSFEPGVHIHATLAQNLLDGLHFRRPREIIFLELAVLLIIGLVGGFVMARQGAVGQVLTASALALSWALVQKFAFFDRGIMAARVIVFAEVFLTLLVVALWRFIFEEREKRKTKRALGQYLSPAVMKKVLEHPEEYLRLGGRRYDATVLFSDIRGFTTFSEGLTPEALGALLNRYMTPMTHIVFENGGTLDKYIGDAVMAFWGAPVEQADHAVRAARAALQMMAKVKELNVEFERDKLPVIAIGIGLSSGPMTIGNMGSETYFAYTALGDRVNLGSRLEGQTKTYGVDILVAEDTYRAIRSSMLCRELDALRVKGKHEPVKIFELIGEQPGTPAQRAWIDKFHDARAAYLGRDFVGAEALFEESARLGGSHDKASVEYAELSRQYQKTPPPPEWDGVRVATSK